MNRAASNVYQQILSLPAEQRILLLKQLREKNKNSSGVATIKKQPREEGANSFPLSFAQQGMWLLAQMEPENPFYNQQMLIRFKGALNVEALEWSFNQVIKRHEILRTRFQPVNEQPVQEIAPSSSILLSVIDLSGLPFTVKSAEAKQCAVSYARQPFDLAQGPLLRVTLLQVDDQEYLLLMIIHHIISDHWSISIFFRDIAAFYKAFPDKTRVALPTLPIQYADYAAWQRNWLQGKVLETHLAYWKQQLGRKLPVLDFSTSRVRPPIQTFQGALYSFTIPQSLYNSLKKLTQQEKSTLFVVLLSAFKALLYFYTNTNDILVGIPIAGRHRASTENLIGFFANTLVLRTYLSHDSTFRELIKQTHKVTFEATAHQELPFEKLVDELNPERSLSYSPVFQVMFGHSNMLNDFPELPNLTLSFEKLDMGKAIFDLNMLAEEFNEQLHIDMEYSSAIFDEDAIVRMAGHFQTLLESVVSDPQQRLSAINFVTQAEQHQLLIEFNRTKVAFPVNRNLSALFEEQVSLRPDAVAVVCGEQHLTYAALDQQANFLAQQLRLQGVQSECLVVLLMKREIQFLVAMLAIFKANGVYVPLHPDHPSKRLKQIFEQNEISVVMTTNEFKQTVAQVVEALQPHSRPSILLCDALTEHKTPLPLPANYYGPDNAAYIIYTSGSTGIPKGAIIHQRGMINHLYAKIDDLKLSSADIVSQTASQTFDISIWQLWAVLLVGGQVEIVKDEDVSDPLALLDLLERKRFTVFESVPSVLTEMLSEITLSNHRPDLSELRWLIATGEALSPNLCRKWFAAYPRIPIVNAYGPTECSDDVTHYFLDNTPADNVAHIPIGQPVANTQIYILDQHCKLLPIGIVGELCVGGMGVGRGYLRDPRKTAEVFIPNPFGNDAGARLYRTGDLARYLSDGTIEVLGRIDHQVKIRGFRIELGEIEAALGMHPSVKQVAVIMHEYQPGSPELIAYLVTHSSQEISSRHLQQWLSELLPDYMIPQIFVVLSSIPLTANGKVDRKSLAIPNVTRQHLALANSFQLPQTSLEKRIAELWKTCLQINQLGIHDNFFSLGGNSLLAVQLLSRMRHQLQAMINLREFFQMPTIAGVAQRIEPTSANNIAFTYAPITKHNFTKDQFIPLSLIQQGLWILHQFEPEDPLYNVITTIQLRGQLNLEALTYALTELIRRHAVLRTTFATVNGQPSQRIAQPELLSPLLVDFCDLDLAIRTSQISQLVQDQARLPFNISTGPLIRVILIKSAMEEHEIFLGMHHIITDGWSLGIFAREFEELYTAFLQNRAATLTELPIQYADFAIWQQQQSQKTLFDDQLQYWKRQLLPLPPRLQFLAISHPTGTRNTAGGQELFTISDELTQQLMTVSREENTTLFALLMTAFLMLLYHHTKQEDIVIGTDVANRPHPELERVMGFFVNQLALRSSLVGNPTLRELLRRVRDVLEEALEHQDVPFERLVSELRVKRSHDLHPLFQVKLAFQHALWRTLELPNLQVDFRHIDNRGVSLDLLLLIWETPHGLEGAFNYKTTLFDKETIVRMVEQFKNVLTIATKEPDIALRSLVTSWAEDTRRQQMVDKLKHKENKYARFKSTQPKSYQLQQEPGEDLATGPTSAVHSSSLQRPVSSVDTVQDEACQFELFHPEQTLPLVIRPRVTDINVAEWIDQNYKIVTSKLLENGAILFRDFRITTVTAFEQTTQAICKSLFSHNSEHVPQPDSKYIQTPVFYSSERQLLWHNENSFNYSWPTKIMFCCIQIAKQGGETPIVDSRSIFAQIPQAIREPLLQKKIMYVRNYGAGLGLDWQTVFSTDDRALVEAKCKSEDIHFAWRADGSLKTWQIRPAAIKHPNTQEWAWFNQAQHWHISCLDVETRKSLLSLLDEDHLPRNCYYGDGTPIPDEHMEKILEVYRRLEVCFTWQVGDVLAIDNVLTAHGRNPYVGTRKILVALGDMKNYDQVVG